MNIIISWLKSLFVQEPTQNQIFCYCGNDLFSSGTFVSDTEESDGNHVRYLCSKCGEESDWNFDIAPVAIRRPRVKGNTKYHGFAIAKYWRDPECRIVDIESGKTIKRRGERLLSAEFIDN